MNPNVHLAPERTDPLANLSIINEKIEAIPEDKRIEKIDANPSALSVREKTNLLVNPSAIAKKENDPKEEDRPKGTEIRNLIEIAMIGKESPTLPETPSQEAGSHSPGRGIGKRENLSAPMEVEAGEEVQAPTEKEGNEDLTPEIRREDLFPETMIDGKEDLSEKTETADKEENVQARGRENLSPEIPKEETESRSRKTEAVVKSHSLLPNSKKENRDLFQEKKIRTPRDRNEDKGAASKERVLLEERIDSDTKKILIEKEFAPVGNPPNYR